MTDEMKFIESLLDNVNVDLSHLSRMVCSPKSPLYCTTIARKIEQASDLVKEAMDGIEEEGK